MSDKGDVGREIERHAYALQQAVSQSRPVPPLSSFEIFARQMQSDLNIGDSMVPGTMMAIELAWRELGPEQRQYYETLEREEAWRYKQQEEKYLRLIDEYNAISHVLQSHGYPAEVGSGRSWESPSGTQPVLGGYERHSRVDGPPPPAYRDVSIYPRDISMETGGMERFSERIQGDFRASDPLSLKRSLRGSARLWHMDKADLSIPLSGLLNQEHQTSKGVLPMKRKPQEFGEDNRLALLGGKQDVHLEAGVEELVEMCISNGLASSNNHVLGVQCGGIRGAFLEESMQVLCACSSCRSRQHDIRGRVFSCLQYLEHAGMRTKDWKSSLYILPSPDSSSSSGIPIALWLQKQTMVQKFHVTEGEAPQKESALKNKIDGDSANDLRYASAQHGKDMAASQSLQAVTARSAPWRDAILGKFKAIFLLWPLHQCCICDQDELEDNDLLTCERCGISVHMNCYGISRPTSLEQGWMCKACLHANENDGLQPQCCLCPYVGGALKKTTVSEIWCHLRCAYWVPWLTVSDPSAQEPVEGIRSVPRKLWESSCVHCKQSMGVKISCSRCEDSYHPICATISCCSLDRKQSDQRVNGFLCPKHIQGSTQPFRGPVMVGPQWKAWDCPLKTANFEQDLVYCTPEENAKTVVPAQLLYAATSATFSNCWNETSCRDRVIVGSSSNKSPWIHQDELLKMEDGKSEDTKSRGGIKIASVNSLGPSGSLAMSLDPGLLQSPNIDSTLNVGIESENIDKREAQKVTEPKFDNINVVCNSLKGVFDLSKMIVLPEGVDHFVSPTEFERQAGRGSAKKWRTSIRIDMGNGVPGQTIESFMVRNAIKPADPSARSGKSGPLAPNIAKNMSRNHPMGLKSPVQLSPKMKQKYLISMPLLDSKRASEIRWELLSRCWDPSDWKRNRATRIAKKLSSGKQDLLNNFETLSFHFPEQGENAVQNLRRQQPVGPQTMLLSPGIEPTLHDRIMHTGNTSMFRLVAGKSMIHNYGLFLRAHTCKSNLLIQLQGDILTGDDLHTQVKHYNKNGIKHFIVKLDDDHFLDVTKVSQDVSIVNHSCNPTLFIKRICVGGIPHIMFFSRDHLSESTELTVDYRSLTRVGQQGFQCSCLSYDCCKELQLS